MALDGSRSLVWFMVGLTLVWGLFIYYDFTTRSMAASSRSPYRELISPDEQEKSHPPPPSASKQTLRVAYLCSPNLAILPLLGYGGTESSCEAELDGLNELHKDDCLDFFAVVPTRKHPVPAYPFPIVEVGKPGISGSEFVDLFVNEMNKWDKDKWPHLIWCQEEYCPDQFRKRGIDMPVVTTIHYGDGYNAKDMGPSVLYRFPSHYVFKKSLRSKPWIKDRGFVEWQAFKEDEFELSEEQGEYFLWVGGCYWDAQKGLPLFQELAKQNPQYKFVVYCSGEPPVARRLQQFQKEVKNFEFRGELMRGAPHREAFKKAKALFFWTHMEGETFGRVIIESFSKGTPVLGSTHAANPELITAGTGIITENSHDIVAAFNRTFDRRAIYERAQYFRAKNIVQGLLQKTRKWFTQLEHFHTFTEPSCLRRATEGGP